MSSIDIELTRDLETRKLEAGTSKKELEDPWTSVRV